MRFDMISEHIATTEKSMAMITKLSAEKEIYYNYTKSDGIYFA